MEAATDIRSLTQTTVPAYDSPSLVRYRHALGAAIAWLERSCKKGKGGSSAYYGLWGLWARPYPETTGYLIPTLLEYAAATGENRHRELAEDLGWWLLSIQRPEGFWLDGLHPSTQKAPSVFNTGQILQGMSSLYRLTADPVWLAAEHRAARWLIESMDEGGSWQVGNYSAGFNPSYYSRVAWPMLQVWKDSGDEQIRQAAETLLTAILQRRLENGVIAGWGFAEHDPAFTHTIAYTIEGFIESALLLDAWPRLGRPIEAALEVLVRKTELNGGRLPGMYDDKWQTRSSAVCLTGNAQLARCLLRWHQVEPDLRLVNAACKLIDEVLRAQHVRHVLPGIRGGIAGSKPLWGAYIAFRYPNWAAKFLADSLLLLMDILRREGHGS